MDSPHQDALRSAEVETTDHAAAAAVNLPAAMMPHVAIVLPGLRAGGSERVVAHITKGLADANRISIVTFEHPDELSYYPLDPRVTVYGLDLPATPRPVWRGYWQMWRRIRALRATFRAIEPDIAIAFLTKTNILTLLAARPLGFPVVVSERNNPVVQRFGRAWELARRRVYPRASAFVTMTEGAASFYPPAQRPRTTIIRNPVEARRVPPRSPRPDGRMSLVAVGRLDQQKGFDLLLEAFAAIADRRPHWRLIIWGEGPERAALEAQRARLGLGPERVVMPGLTPTPGDWIYGADAFVLSSRFEGWANVLAEALAARLPVVSFACNYGPPEMIEHGVSGLLVEPGSVSALADAMEEITGDAALRQRLGEGCHGFAAAHSTTAIVERWQQLIDTLLTAPAAR